jgi:hypothetical protein
MELPAGITYINVIQRLKNLWAWSAIHPRSPLGNYVLNGYDEKQQDKAVIVYPSRVEEILKAKPDAGIDEIIS